MVNKKHNKTTIIIIFIIIIVVSFIVFFQSFYFPLPITRIVCEVSDGNRRIYLEQRMGIGYSYSRHAKTHIGLVWAGDKLKFDNGEFFGEKTLFPSEEVTYSGFSKATCSGSKIIGDTVYVNPVSTSHMDTPNGMYVSQDNGENFNFRAIPGKEYPPIIVDQDGYLYKNLKYWSGNKVSIKNGYMEIEQVLIFRGSKSDIFIDSEPVIWRLMESRNLGVSWGLKDYKLLKPQYIPKDISILLERKKLKMDYNKKFPPYMKVVD